MVNLTIELNCDGCPRTQYIKIDGAVCIPLISGLLGAHGWAQYLGGPVLCSECVQNVDTIDKVTQMFLGIGKPGIVQQEAKPKPVIKEALPDPEISSKRQKSKTDEEILQAFRLHSKPIIAARSIGMRYNAYYNRVKTMRKKGLIPYPEHMKSESKLDVAIPTNGEHG